MQCSSASQDLCPLVSKYPRMLHDASVARTKYVMRAACVMGDVYR